MINEFKAGIKVCQAAIVKVQKVGTASNGKLFARGMIEDNSGRMPFVCFDTASVEKLQGVEAPTAFMVSGAIDINKFANDMSLQIIVQKFEEILPNDDITHLLPQGDFDIEAYKAKLADLIRAVRSPMIRSLLDNIFTGAIYDKFIVNPAGTRMHHGYIGGLLQHSVDVAELAVAMAAQIGNADKDLIIAGALLHDIGKLREISPQLGFPYTDEGRLVGHIAMSSMLVQDIAARLKIPAQKLEQLQHILLSHHGDNEKGSPIACVTREAFIVHYADEVNAIMNQFDTNDGQNTWEYNRMLQRNLYHGKQ